MEETFDAGEMLNDFDAGVFMQKVSAAVRSGAIATIEHDRKSKIVIELELEKMGDSRQVMVDHTLKFTKPTRRGKATEEDTTTTPMYVGIKGGVTVTPIRQTDMFKTEQEANS
jgi:hypothetical protein